MFVDHDNSRGETTAQERRDGRQSNTRILGRVVHCDGARATVSGFAEQLDGTAVRHWSIGQLISINLGATRTVGLVYSIERQERSWVEEETNPVIIHVELVGEVREVDGKPVFDRGITLYPHIGAVAHRIRQRDLGAVYDLGGRRALDIGSLSQDETISARIAIDETLSRHFAVVGTTGVGKSTAVASLLRKAVEARPDLRVLILDPHNEFASALGSHAVRIDGTNLDLPFWLFRLEELAEVLYRGREHVAEEVELLRDLIPQAKQLYRNPSPTPQLRRLTDAQDITADTPVPYRIVDLLKLIDDRRGQLDAKHDRAAYRQLRTRIEAAIHDPRYRFMFASRLIEDTIHQTIGRIFRVPHEGHPVTCFEMAGMPSEVVNAVCSVLARMAFDMAMLSGGRYKLLVLCEEAHRYVPADPRLGFAPTRHALSRIAKEGRKYGCYLGVVTQRPGELDPTILSQCSTVFAMRLANEADKAIIRAAIADSSASTLSFLSSMGQREAIAFGEGVATTMRMKFEHVPDEFLPGAHQDDDAAPSPVSDDEVDLVSIVDRMRNQGNGAAARAPAPTEQAAASTPFRFGDDSAERRLGRLQRRVGDPGYRPFDD